MIIRPATETDIPALIEIGHKFFAFNPYRHFMELDEDCLAGTLRGMMNDHVLLVAEVGGVVGTAGAMVAPLYWNHAHLHGLELFWWLDPEHRGGGNGKFLRKTLEDAVRARGVRFWNMVALEDSMPDQVGEMYRKAGFQPVEHVYMKVL